MAHSLRTARFAQISTALALQTDRQLTLLVDQAEQLATGIGAPLWPSTSRALGYSLSGCGLQIWNGRPEHRMSTANIYQLPTFCQRNVGSVGFGVWRELVANVMTTGWVLKAIGELPLDVPLACAGGRGRSGGGASVHELADIQGMVSYWEGSDVKLHTASRDVPYPRADIEALLRPMTT